MIDSIVVLGFYQKSQNPGTGPRQALPLFFIITVDKQLLAAQVQGIEVAAGGESILKVPTEISLIGKLFLDAPVHKSETFTV